MIPRVEPRPGRQKRCRGPCGELLPIECFTRDRANPDGRRNECGVCRQARREELDGGAPRRKPWATRPRRGVLIDGRLTTGIPGFHRFVDSWPPRLVSLERWMECPCCHRAFRIWMTSDKTWQRLAPELHDKTLCVRCFRKLVTGRETPLIEAFLVSQKGV